MIARLESQLGDLADLSHDLVLGPFGGARMRRVGQRRERLLALLLSDARALRQLLDLRTHLLQLLLVLLHVLAALAGLRELLGLLALLRAQTLRRGGRRAPLLVLGEHLIELLAKRTVAAGERRADALGVLTDALDVKHRPPPASYFVDSVMGVVATCCAWRPEYLARNAATARASSPSTTFSGMIAPEKPPLRIA